MKSQQFNGGQGLQIHIRTTRSGKGNTIYSYISEAAIQIGTNVLEVSDEGSIMIDGAIALSNLNQQWSSFAGFPIVKTFKGKNKKINVYTLTLSRGNSIQIRANTKNKMLFVDVSGDSIPGDTVGLLGSPTSTNRALFGRDGVTDLTEAWNTYGQDWQVQVGEPNLFQDKKRVPQSPVPCLYDVLPENKSNVRRHHSRRRLVEDQEGSGIIDMDLVAKACKKAAPRKKQFCLDDVMTTGDYELAHDSFYQQHD